MAPDLDSFLKARKTKKNLKSSKQKKNTTSKSSNGFQNSIFTSKPDRKEKKEVNQRLQSLEGDDDWEDSDKEENVKRSHKSLSGKTIGVLQRRKVNTEPSMEENEDTVSKNVVSGATFSWANSNEEKKVKEEENESEKKEIIETKVEETENPVEPAEAEPLQKLYVPPNMRGGNVIKSRSNIYRPKNNVELTEKLGSTEAFPTLGQSVAKLKKSVKEKPRKKNDLVPSKSSAKPNTEKKSELKISTKTKVETAPTKTAVTEKVTHVQTTPLISVLPTCKAREDRYTKLRQIKKERAIRRRQQLAA